MNQTTLRWKIYNLLNKREVIRVRKGGYSIKRLYDFVHALYDLELGLFSDPFKALKELTFCKTLESL